MATVQEIVLAAQGRSSRNRGQQIAADSLELLDVVRRAVRACFAVAARLNPLYFGKISTVALADFKWAWPADLEAFLRVEHDGLEAAVVPFDDRQAERTRPAIYYFGRSFYPAGNAGDPAAGSLTYYYARRPVDPANFAAAVDPEFPEAYVQLLIDEVALYLALKDDRGGEYERLVADRDRWLALFAAHLEHVTGVVETRRKGGVRTIISNTLVPLGSLFQGGTGVVG